MMGWLRPPPFLRRYPGRRLAAGRVGPKRWPSKRRSCTLRPTLPRGEKRNRGQLRIYRWKASLPWSVRSSTKHGARPKTGQPHSHAIEGEAASLRDAVAAAAVLRAEISALRKKLADSVQRAQQDAASRSALEGELAAAQSALTAAQQVGRALHALATN